MARIKWDASGQAGSLSPNDSMLKNDKSAMTASNFGGHREHSDVAASKDYTARVGAVDIKENPIDTVVKDIDDLADSKQRKNEFGRQENISNTQSGNESAFMTSTDSDNRPLEDTDGFVSDGHPVKRLRSKNKYHFGDGQYEGELR